MATAQLTRSPATGAAAKAAAEAARQEAAAGQVSQWTLMRWRFTQNRLSVAALGILIVMYLIAALAPFIAPYDAADLDADYAFAAPTKLAWIAGRPAVCPLEQTLDRYYFKWIYTADCSQARPIELFTQGASYGLLGPIKANTHLFGVTAGPPLVANRRDEAAQPSSPAAMGTIPADDPMAAYIREQQARAAAEATSPSGAPPGPNAAAAAAAGSPPAPAAKAPKLFVLGADQQGRDLLSRILIGSRVSLTIGLVGVALSLTIGSLLGAASGYLGGTADNVIQRVVEIVRSMPTLPLWAAIAAALPRTTTVTQRYFLITVVLSFVGWTGLARELRGKVMAYRSLDYIAAARLAGSSHLRIIVSHMLPNAASHIIVIATLAVPASIIGETTLSFLGLGMLPPAVSWGVLLKDTQQLGTVLLHPWMLLPAIPVIVAVACYFLLGDGLRDAIDPYS